MTRNNFDTRFSTLVTSSPRRRSTPPQRGRRKAGMLGHVAREVLRQRPPAGLPRSGAVVVVSASGAVAAVYSPPASSSSTRTISSWLAEPSRVSGGPIS